MSIGLPIVMTEARLVSGDRAGTSLCQLARLQLPALSSVRVVVAMLTLGVAAAPIVAPAPADAASRPLDLAGAGAGRRSRRSTRSSRTRPDARRRWSATTASNLDATARYVQAARRRRQLGGRRARHPRRDAARRVGAHRVSTSRHALLAAMTQLGVPYRSNSSEPGVGFDCSGLAMYAWGDAGIGSASSEPGPDQRVDEVERAAAQAGRPGVLPGSHEMFLGIGDAMVHSPQRGQRRRDHVPHRAPLDNVVFADPTIATGLALERLTRSCVDRAVRRRGG